MRVPRTGAPAQVKNPASHLRDIAKAHKYKGENARHQSFGHRQNVNRHIERGTVDTQHRFALIDYRNGNEVIKTSTMSYRDAYQKNKALKGTGIAWARVDASFKAKKGTSEP